jgi:hypothetical protein
VCGHLRGFTVFLNLAKLVLEAIEVILVFLWKHLLISLVLPNAVGISSFIAVGLNFEKHLQQ